MPNRSDHRPAKDREALALAYEQPAFAVAARSEPGWCGVDGDEIEPLRYQVVCKRMKVSISGNLPVTTKKNR
jgi:hypothetical protein